MIIVDTRSQTKVNGRLIKEMRLNKKLSIANLSELTDIPRGRLYCIEQCRPQWIYTLEAKRIERALELK